MHHSVFMQVLERLLSVEDSSVAAILPGTMAAIVQALQRHKHACGLNVISSAIETFHRDHAQQHIIQDAFKQACLAVAPLLQVRDPLLHRTHHSYAPQVGL